MYIYDSGKTSVIKFKNNDVKKTKQKKFIFLDVVSCKLAIAAKHLEYKEKQQRQPGNVE